jgi:hypothetical protein
MSQKGAPGVALANPHRALGQVQGAGRFFQSPAAG